MSETIEVTVDDIRFHNQETGFTVMVCWHHESHTAFTVVGTFNVPQPDELVAVVGEWCNDARYGRQFVAESVTPMLPATIDGILAWLQAGHVQGIGRRLAQRLIDRFGAQTLQVIDETPERLLEMRGVGPRTLATIKESWDALRSSRDVMIFLAEHGLSGARAFRIQKEYGDRSIAIIRQNPYRLAYEIRGIGFPTADTVAQKLGHDARSPFRLLAGLRHVLEQARTEGHCGIAVDEAIRKSAELLAVEPALLSAIIATAIEMKVVIEEKRVLYDPYLHQAESRIAKSLARLAATKPEWSGIKPPQSDVPLDFLQRRAIDLALRSKALVVTGGAGVGKTTLVRALLAMYESAKLKVSLAAPTGRAAKRLAESTGAEAATIHRLLEMSPLTGNFLRRESEPLETDVVIVDEASMVDVPLLDAILRAMPPHAAIVLVGDADQLPSIGPGQVLYDILESGRVPSIRLTEIHRQAEGSDIIENAHRVRAGEMPLFGAAKDNAHTFLFPKPTPADAVACVVDVVTNRIPKTFGFRSLRDVQVLVPVRKGPVGVETLNEALQNALNPPARHEARVELPGVVFCPRDKVMQKENNYHKHVFNGDVGVVATVDMEEERFTVDFGADLIVDYQFDEADQLSLAYATTIHKSQGSEYEAVVIALMQQHYVMLRRNLLYTAVTRGRKVVVVVGEKKAVATAVRTGGGGERVTRLRQCLIATM